MSTETLNWQDVISGWSFTCGGEAPPEGLDASVVPAVTRTISGAYEITTISFGFSGTAPYYQQKFTAVFSGRIMGFANLYSVSVSSDDSARMMREATKKKSLRRVFRLQRVKKLNS